jgi:predicted secreted protein
MKRVWLAAMAVVLVGAGAAQAVVPAPKVLKAADTGKTVRLVPGQELQIRLSVCASCGYRWETRLAPDKAVLTRLKQRQSSGNCQAPCVGGTAVTTFRYRAKADGTTKLRLAYIPPGRQPAAKAFKLRVIVGS